VGRRKGQKQVATKLRCHQDRLTDRDLSLIVTDCADACQQVCSLWPPHIQEGGNLHNVCYSLVFGTLTSADTRTTAFKSHRSSLSPLLRLLLPHCHPRIMSVLSERPTAPPDTSQPTITPTSDAPIAIPDVVVNGRRQNASGAPPQRRPKSSASSHNASGNDDWGSNFWVTLVDPQVSTPPWPRLNGTYSIRSNITA